MRWPRQVWTDIIHFNFTLYPFWNLSWENVEKDLGGAPLKTYERETLKQRWD